MNDDAGGVSALQRPVRPASEARRTFRINDCEEAFVRDFCPYKGNPDPLTVWRAAWESAKRDSEYEERADGAVVRKDRWEWAVRRIVALLWGNRREFEVDEVVEAVRVLVPCPHAEGDDEALTHAAQKGFGA